MCRIKCGEELKTEADLQNLITGVILRQQGMYKKSDIFRIVSLNCDNSPFSNYPKLNMNIQNTLNAFVRCQMIRCVDGVYKPQRV